MLRRRVPPAGPPSPDAASLREYPSARRISGHRLSPDVASGAGHPFTCTEGLAMDFIFWIILIVVIGVIIWWLLNRNKSANPPGGPSADARSDEAAARPRADGALEGGSAAASAQAAGTTGIPTAAGFGRAAEPAAPSTAEEPADSSATSTRQEQGADRAADQAEWETQWSEAAGAPRSGSSATGTAATPAEPRATSLPTEQADTRPETSASQASTPAARPVHHDEYTAPHAPTLPGAETAAVESADDGGTAAAGQAGGQQAPRQETETSAPASRQEPMAPAAGGVQRDAGTAETLERAQSSALVENGADHQAQSAGAQAFDQEQGSEQGQDLSQGQGTALPEPAGHLAADEPYGAGSAAPGPDGSGPEDYTVKGDAAAMVYYEEGHPDYEQTRAEVWFESAAHAEAAGFRAPRRKRL